MAKSKIILILAVGLSTIVSISACSIALPNFVYFYNAELTENPDLIIIEIADGDYNKWDLVYDIQNNELREKKDEVSIQDVKLTSSAQNYNSSLNLNETGAFWELKDENNSVIFDINLQINDLTLIDSSQGFVAFVSESLNTAYMILP
ncbi:MAG: hypothetical protein ACW99A_14280, partial [Candidatus Kariarchaeaceae archaeon]